MSLTAKSVNSEESLCVLSLTGAAAGVSLAAGSAATAPAATATAAGAAGAVG